MALRFTPNFSRKDIARFIENRLKVLEQIIFDQLVDVGEEFVSNMRMVDTYKDRTSNLRGSIGYAILKDGKSIFGNFDGSAVGVKVAEKRVKALKADYPKGYVLIVVAGMEYAAFVEAKGFDVITGSSLKAEINLERQIERLRSQLKKVA